MLPPALGGAGEGSWIFRFLPPQVLAQASRAGRIAGARRFLRAHQLRFAMNVTAGRIMIKLALRGDRYLSRGQMHRGHAVAGEKSCGRTRPRIAVSHHRRCQQRRDHHSCPNPAAHVGSPRKQVRARRLPRPDSLLSAASRRLSCPPSWLSWPSSPWPSFPFWPS